MFSSAGLFVLLTVLAIEMSRKTDNNRGGSQYGKELLHYTTKRIQIMNKNMHKKMI